MNKLLLTEKHRNYTITQQLCVSAAVLHLPEVKVGV